MNENRKWQEIPVAKMSPGEVREALGDRSVFVLDVRPLDFALDNKFIRGSTHCALVHLADRCSGFPLDRKIVVTDWAMKQSPPAARFLIEKGFNVMGILKGGVERWVLEELPSEERAALAENR
jgi:rhodanese-related sulfurtransferase